MSLGIIPVILLINVIAGVRYKNQNKELLIPKKMILPPYIKKKNNIKYAKNIPYTRKNYIRYNY